MTIGGNYQGLMVILLLILGVIDLEEEAIEKK